MTPRERLFRAIDREYPFRGPCGFCGFHDARHRLFCVLNGSPESSTRTAAWYEQSVSLVRNVRRMMRDRNARRAFWRRSKKEAK